MNEEDQQLIEAIDAHFRPDPVDSQAFVVGVRAAMWRRQLRLGMLGAGVGVVALVAFGMWVLRSEEGRPPEAPVVSSVPSPSAPSPSTPASGRSPLASESPVVPLVPSNRTPSVESAPATRSPEQLAAIPETPAPAVQGNARMVLVGNDRVRQSVRLVAADGTQYGVGPIPAGAFDILLGGVKSGEATVGPGQTLRLDCNDAFQLCRVLGISPSEGVAEPAPIVSVEPIPSLRRSPDPVRPVLLEAIRFTSNPTGATVFVDGAEVGTTPVIHSIPPGPHSVRWVLGTEALESEITVDPDGPDSWGWRVATGEFVESP
jgi:hypothetical protein